MGYELEWDKDFFDIYLLHGDSQLLLNRFNGDKFGINTYYIPMLLSELNDFWNLLFVFNSDSTVNYRGIQIDKIKIHKASTVYLDAENNNYNIPNKFILQQNYPNPFNPSTQINYTVPISTELSISIFDIKGNKIHTLVDKKHNKGEYSIVFDASFYSSGIYFYKLKTDKIVINKKLMLIK